MSIGPEFVVNGLEFSQILECKYTWDDLMAIEWHDGWRVPKKWELSMLYEEDPRSRCEHFLWANSIVDGYYGQGVSSGSGYDIYNERNSSHYTRLVRDINQ
jgi:hypothetical protein